MEGSPTFECKFFLKACKIVEGDLLIFASVAVPPMFGSGSSGVESLEGKSFSKALKRSIASPNFLSIFSDISSLAPNVDFNASSAAISTLFNDFVSH